VLLTVLTLFLAARLGSKGGLPETFDASGLVAALLARPLAYPLVFPGYTSMTDAIALLVVAAWALLVAAALRHGRNHAARTAIVTALLVLAMQAAVTVALRPGVTSMLAGYLGSFPDRYFVGMNMLAVFATVLAAGTLLESGSRHLKVGGAGALAVLALVHLAGLPLLFELGTPRYPIKIGPTFPQQLCAAKITPDGRFAVITIYPHPWTMSAPAARVPRSFCAGQTGLLARLRAPVP